MRLPTFLLTVLLSVVLSPALAQEKAASSGPAAKIVASLQGQEGKELPNITAENVVVLQGKDRLHVTQWAPAKDDALVLFIVVDDTCDTRLGGLLDDVRSFIQSQPANAAVGVAYMSNNVARVVQDPTTDHDKASQALRLPMGTLGSRWSAYLALMDLIKRWPAHEGRKEMVVISDGIDRFTRRFSRLEASAPSSGARSLIGAAQRAGVVIHAIYAQGSGHWARNVWEMKGGVDGLSQVADETGGESFFLGYQNPPSFKPYFDQLQNVLNNQYWLGFDMKPATKPGLQAIETNTDISGAEIVAANAVYVTAGK